MGNAHLRKGLAPKRGFYAPRSCANSSTKIRILITKMGKLMPSKPAQLISEADTFVNSFCHRVSGRSPSKKWVLLASRNAPPMPNGMLATNQGSVLMSDRTNPSTGSSPKQTSSNASQAPRQVNKSFLASSFIGNMSTGASNRG